MFRASFLCPSLALAISTILLPGCTSYRVVGNVPAASAFARQPLKHTYRLERVKVEYDNVREMPLLAWCLEFALGKIPVNDFEERIAQKRPDVFRDDTSSIPIVASIRFRARDESLGWTIIVPYFVSFGTLPAMLQVDDLAAVSVQRRDTMQTVTETEFTFQHKMKLTAFSPIALINFDDVPATTACTTGNGLMQNPGIDAQVRDRIADAIAETLTAAIITQLRILETTPAITSPAVIPPSAVAPIPAAVPSAAAPAAPVPPVAAGTTVPPAQTPPRETLPVEAQVRKLQELRNSGIITEKEYNDLLLRTAQQIH